MLEWVVDALQSSDEIANLCIVGLPALDGLAFNQPVDCLPDHGGIAQNAIAGVKYFKERGGEYIMVSTADIPLITPSMISEFISQCRPFDAAVYYAFHSRQAVEDRFPRSGRTFFKLRDQEVTSSNVGIVHTTLLDTDPALWAAIANARKAPWRIARLVGLGTLLRFLCKRIGIEDAATIASRTFDRPVKFMLNRTVEFGMDGDTPAQIEVMRAILRQQSAVAKS